MTALLILTLTAFLGFTAYVVVTFGIVGAFENAVIGIVGVQLMVDLLLALGLIMIWMWRDSKQRGLPFWRYALLTATTGSAGPIAYLIHRRVQRHAADARPWTLPKWAQIVLAVDTAAFAGLAGWMIVDVGVSGFIRDTTSNLAATLGLVDLCLALTMILGWMVFDARKRQLVVWPHVILTLCFGSLGWMTWMLRTRNRTNT